jgi:hypothetical protein
MYAEGRKIDILPIKLRDALHAYLSAFGAEHRKTIPKEEADKHLLILSKKRLIL